MLQSDPGSWNEYGGEKAISSEAWDIIMQNEVVPLNEDTTPLNPQPPIQSNYPIKDNVPDISNINSDVLFKKPVKQASKPINESKQTPTKVLLTEQEISILVEAKKIIDKVVEMTTCGMIGVNMANNNKAQVTQLPKIGNLFKMPKQKPVNKTLRYLKKKQKKKNLLEYLKNE